jgi:hypothetical protein
MQRPLAFALHLQKEGAIADVTQALKSGDEGVSFVYVRPAQEG